MKTETNWGIVVIRCINWLPVSSLRLTPAMVALVGGALSQPVLHWASQEAPLARVLERLDQYAVIIVMNHQQLLASVLL